MTHAADFHAQYAAALRAYMSAQGEGTLAVGHELGRRALQERISMLEIIENHSRLVDDPACPLDSSAALQFLLQTLAALDVATRGFLDGTRRYEQQRARAEVLADRNEFRTALVNSLQEGFFVADGTGAVVEVNDAFTDITGYGPEGLPYAWPHPWMAADNEANERLARLLAQGNLDAEAPIRHRDGHTVWVAMSVNAVKSPGDEDAYVGTIRDITAARAAADRERAVAQLATSVSVARSVGEVLSTTLEACRDRLGVKRVLAVTWPAGDHDPAVHMAGESSASTWRDVDRVVRRTLEYARDRLPLTVEPVGWTAGAEESNGMVAVLSRDTSLWLEFSDARRVSADDKHLVAALAGHLSLAIQHVRQFEIARDTSLTLQRSMLGPMDLPAGFAVRYEPAVPPLEIGGDWYDAVPVGGGRIGIIVGDCVGRGLSAAAVMGQLRSSARALLLTGTSPARLLEQLDSVATFIPDAFCTTVFAAILDTESGTLVYSSAGHVPAVLVPPGSDPVLLTEARSVPLAVHRTEPRPQATQELTPGATLLAYTDGLVERRDQPIDKQIGHVANAVVGTLDLPVDDVAEVVLDRLAPADGYEDDVAIVLYRQPQSTLVIENDATAEQLSEVRHRLAAWLHAAKVSEPLASDIVLAVNEACSNSAEHAYRGSSHRTMRVEAKVDASHIGVQVADTGSWKAPAATSHTRGRGLPLIRALSERVDVHGTPAGTTIHMSFRLPAATAKPQR